MKKKILPIRLILVVFLFTVACSCLRDERKNPVHPNIILILADDQGWGDVRHHGNELIETPVLDRLAQEGTEFRNFYVEPLCAPTRAGLLTGKYYLRTGTSWVSRGLENMASTETTLAEIFRDNGYTTGCFGKWHNGAHYLQHPNRQGFDVFTGFCAGHWNNYFNTTLEENGKPVKAEGYITDYLTNRAINFIRKNRNNPFFCYIPYNVPHSPFQVPDSYFLKYKDKGLDDRNACIYGMITNMDENIGKILNTLDSLSLSKNTAVIFMSDNGPNGHRYNGVLKGIKGSIDEGGVKVPFIIRWTGTIPAGKITGTTGACCDIVPTLAELCNLKVPDTIMFDGISLAKVITGEEIQHVPRTVFSKKSSQILNADGAVRTDTFRLVIRNQDTLLYNMPNDPGQKEDVHGKYPEVTHRLSEAYRKYFMSVSSVYQPHTTVVIGAKGDTLDYFPAHEAYFSGKPVYREGHGWAHDWLINWSDTVDRIWWKIKSLATGKYEILVRYTCPAKDTGSVLVAFTGGSATAGKITRPFDPPYIPSPDRVKRIEVYEKPWARQSLGTLTITPGDSSIVLRAMRIPGRQVCELKGVYLHKIGDQQHIKLH